MLYYRYANLCIKADELSLLPIVIVVEGETKKFEDVANVAKDGEYAFKIFPKYDDDLEAVSMGITHEHPEFKQERKTLEVQTEDGKNVEIPYLLVTMPPVDNDRHDVLKQGADALYQECKAQMEAAKTQAEAEIAMLMAGESKDAIDNVNDAVKERHLLRIAAHDFQFPASLCPLDVPLAQLRRHLAHHARRAMLVRLMVDCHLQEPRKLKPLHLDIGMLGAHDSPPSFFVRSQ